MNVHKDGPIATNQISKYENKYFLLSLLFDPMNLLVDNLCLAVIVFSWQALVWLRGSIS